MQIQQKLRLLCLHGYNTDHVVMAHQTRHFQAQFKHQVELYHFDGPYQCQDPVPQELQRFQKEGRPFRRWLQVEDNKYVGLEQAVEHILEYLQDKGPFHGLVGFSQGCIMIRVLLRVVRQIRPEWSSRCQPWFVINVGPPYFPGRQLVFQGEVYSQLDGPLQEDSVTLVGQDDPFKEGMQHSHTLYQDGSLLIYPGGHVFFRELEPANQQSLECFLQKQSSRLAMAQS